MTTMTIVNGLTRSLHKVGFWGKKHSPELLVGAGVVGTVVSAVMACKASTKIHDVLEEAKENIDGIHRVLETPELNEKYEKKYGEKYTEEMSKKDLTGVYVQTGMKFVKLYAPAVILGALSITSILASNNIMRKRNIALAAAYATVDKSFKDYRGRVVERFGEAVDKELRYDIRKKEIEEIVTDENGNEQVVKKTVNVVGDNPCGDYTFFFDAASRAWEKDATMNFMFLRAEQNFANDKLKARGYVFLNEVLERLGLPTTEAGQIVGWVYDPNSKDPNGDNFIDFGFMEMRRERNRAFIEGEETVILLDFNVDGKISDIFHRYSKR